MIVQMINWQEKLNSDTFINDPVPHFRIYDVLPRDLHDMFYNSYMDIVRDKIIEEHHGHTNFAKLHIWTPHKPQPLTSEWLMLLNTLSTGGPEVVDIWNSFSHDNLVIPRPSEHVRFNHWTKEGFVPGKLIQTWHRDGNDPKLVCIYYLGTGEETQGNFELMNENTKEMVDYEYKANSMTIILNHSPQIHRFRQTGFGQDRRTLYTGWRNESP
jgi:hypothetical protein